MTISAYPLEWPVGWPRKQAYQRSRAKFGKTVRSVSQYSSTGYTERKGDLSVADGVTRILEELGRMRVSREDVVISTNVPTRLDGLPRGDAKVPADPGVAVYWRERGKKQPRCMAIDRYDRVQDNLAAIAATLEAMRAIERHGGAEILDRAFTGFTALPAPEQPFQVLGVGANASREEVERAYRLLASEHHPDRPGGDPDKMARINAARDQLLGGT
jgi:DnaJ domain